MLNTAEKRSFPFPFEFQYSNLCNFLIIMKADKEGSTKGNSLIFKLRCEPE